MNKNSKRKWVYIVIENGTSNYKIGVAERIRRRMSQFQVSSPNKISFICAFTSDKPYEEEKKLHEKLKDKNVQGEWFSLKEDELNELVKGLKQKDSFIKDTKELDKFEPKNVRRPLGRKCKFHIVVSEDELKSLRQKAFSYACTVSSYVRGILFGKNPESFEPSFKSRNNDWRNEDFHKVLIKVPKSMYEELYKVAEKELRSVPSIITLMLMKMNKEAEVDEPPIREVPLRDSFGS